MKPALTAEEWATPRLYFRSRWDAATESEGEVRGEPRDNVMGAIDTYGVELVITPATRDDPPLWVWDGSWSVCVLKDVRHALAALCLHDQPFGFTHTDVRLLRQLNEETCHWFHGTDVMGKLADRIEALLPPEAK